MAGGLVNLFSVDAGRFGFHSARYSLLKLQETMPFFWVMVLIALAILTTVATIHPYAIPLSVTLEAAASPRNILLVLLKVMGILLPITLIYNGYNVAVFRGKTSGGYDGDENQSHRD